MGGSQQDRFRFRSELRSRRNDAIGGDGCRPCRENKDVEDRDPRSGMGTDELVCPKEGWQGEIAGEPGTVTASAVDRILLS